jgi:hypothetical protein
MQEAANVEVKTNTKVVETSSVHAATTLCMLSQPISLVGCYWVFESNVTHPTRAVSLSLTVACFACVYP